MGAVPLGLVPITAYRPGSPSSIRKPHRRATPLMSVVPVLPARKGDSSTRGTNPGSEKRPSTGKPW